MMRLKTWLQINYGKLIKKKMLWLSLQMLFTGVCLTFIFRSLEVTSLDVFQIKELSLILCVGVCGLMILNWSLEAWRWQISLPAERLSFGGALITVLRGQALNWVMPFTSGDIGGRLIGLSNAKDGMLAITLNRISILVVTLCYGLFAVHRYFGLSHEFWGLIPIITLLVLFIVLISRQKEVWGLSFRNFNLKLTIKVLGVTLLRYLVFTLQFYLLISYFNPYLADEYILSGIGWIFLFKSFIPSVLGNIGVREASAILFFENQVEDLQLIVLPCTLIWLINGVFPSLIGSLTFFPLRIKLAA